MRTCTSLLPRTKRISRARGVRAWALRVAGRAPLVIGGDFNLRRPRLEGFADAGGVNVDHLFARGLQPAGAPRTLEKGVLSDHPPLLYELASSAPAPPDPEETAP